MLTLRSSSSKGDRPSGWISLARVRNALGASWASWSAALASRRSTCRVGWNPWARLLPLISCMFPHFRIPQKRTIITSMDPKRVQQEVFVSAKLLEFQCWSKRRLLFSSHQNCRHLLCPASSAFRHREDAPDLRQHLLGVGASWISTPHLKALHGKLYWMVT